MPIYFLDTSALQHRYVPGDFSRLVRRVISDGRWNCYIADVTILEMWSTLGINCRKRGWGLKEFDAMVHRFWEDLATGHLKVRTTSKRDVVRAGHLIRFAGVLKGRHLKSADALIAVCCLTLAQEKKQKVVFFLQDRKLYKTLLDVNAFQSALELRYLDS